MTPELRHWIDRFHDALVQHSVPMLSGDMLVPATLRVARLLAEEFAPKCVLCGGMKELATRCSPCEQKMDPSFEMMTEIAQGLAAESALEDRVKELETALEALRMRHDEPGASYAERHPCPTKAAPSVHDLAFKRATECGIRWGFGETRIASLTATLVAMYVEGFDAAEARAGTDYPSQPGDPTVRHVVAWLRATYPLNRNTQDCATEIERVFLSRTVVAQYAGELPEGWDLMEKDNGHAWCAEGPWFNTRQEARVALFEALRHRSETATPGKQGHE